MSTINLAERIASTLDSRWKPEYEATIEEAAGVLIASMVKWEGAAIFFAFDFGFRNFDNAVVLLKDMAELIHNPEYINLLDLTDRAEEELGAAVHSYFGCDNWAGYIAAFLYALKEANYSEEAIILAAYLKSKGIEHTFE